LTSRFAFRGRSTNGVLALSAALGVGAFIGFVLLGNRTPVDLLAAFIASLGAATIAGLVVRSPVSAVGLLLILASISGVFIALPFGRVRLEQPAIIAALITLAATRGWARRSDLPLVLPIAGSFGVYLIVLTLASLLHAPQLAVSARLIVWTALSMGAGVVTFVLVRGTESQGGEGWFTATGVGHGAAGVAIAIAFLLLGPAGIPGMQVVQGEVPKVAGLAFEANLYASMLGALAPFAIERFRTRHDPATAIALVLIVVGLGVGVTRGAYLGLLAGLGVYLAILAFRRRPRGEILAVMGVLAMALILAPSIAWALLPAQPGSSVTPSPAASGPGGATASAPPAPAPALTSTSDNLAYRLSRIPIALEDLKESPIVGLGAGTFGQRHSVPGRPGLRDYLSILALSAVYEAGVVGAAALGIGFLLSLRLILRASKWAPGLAAAYGASIVSLLVAYQASNVLFFSINWIILGAGLGMASRAIDSKSQAKVGSALIS
jgi:hypothetical protein